MDPDIESNAQKWTKDIDSAWLAGFIGSSDLILNNICKQSLDDWIVVLRVCHKGWEEK